MAKETVRENRITRYFRDTVAELRKVNWPTRQEATNLTIVVVVTIVAMSVFLGIIVDGAFGLIVKNLISSTGP